MTVITNNNNNTTTETASSMMEHQVLDPPVELSRLSTALLQTKYQNLVQTSSTIAAQLASKLASSKSLVHIGPSLSTLPPDLQTMEETLQPMVQSIQGYNVQLEQQHSSIKKYMANIQYQKQRSDEITTIVIPIFCHELHSIEQLLTSSNNQEKVDELEYATLLERAAYTCLWLLHYLQTASSSHVTTSVLNKETTAPVISTELAQFILKLAPRIRAVESQTILMVQQKLQNTLQSRMNTATDIDSEFTKNEELLQIGHYLRSLTLLSNTTTSTSTTVTTSTNPNNISSSTRTMNTTAESIFATTSIMPLVRKHLTIGKLDEGGNRGECHGLQAWLGSVLEEIKIMWYDVIMYTECCLFDETKQQATDAVDLLCGSVWVPIATALITDPVIRMAIFSPGIASVLQANYVTLDNFVSNLAYNLLQPTCEDKEKENEEAGEVDEDEESNNDLSQYYYQPKITMDIIQKAQERLYQHTMTKEFYTKWNLPIYYQLRFGQVCTKIDDILTNVQTNGWWTTTVEEEDTTETSESLLSVAVIPMFGEFQSLLEWLWKPNVFVKPLTHRFLRGAIQLIGRLLQFVKDGMDGTIQFGSSATSTVESSNDDIKGDSVLTSTSEQEQQVVDTLYCWAERMEDVAAVSWELSLLQKRMTNEYLDIIYKQVCASDTEKEKEEDNELKYLIAQVLADASKDLSPIIDKSWNTIIVNILIVQCCVPLSAVKGVAATYRMTNRPPPTKASPFVHTILRPLKEFDTSFACDKTPQEVGIEWKLKILSAISERYSTAVAELIETVQRTEEVLKNRKSRISNTAGGKRMSDGDKVKLQLYLDREEFVRCVQDVGVDATTITGVEKLKQLTESANSDGLVDRSIPL